MVRELTELAGDSQWDGAQRDTVRTDTYREADAIP